MAYQLLLDEFGEDILGRSGRTGPNGGSHPRRDGLLLCPANPPPEEKVRRSRSVRIAIPASKTPASRTIPERSATPISEEVPVANRNQTTPRRSPSGAIPNGTAELHLNELNSGPDQHDHHQVQRRERTDPVPEGPAGAEIPRDGDSSVVDGNENSDLTEYGRLGSIVFKLRFLADRSALVVSVVRCRGLPGKNHNSTTTDLTALPAGPLCNGNGNVKQNATDPYVKLQLLPDKQHKVKTRVVRNTRNPVYDEDFTFYGLTLTELAGMSLHFVVLSFDRYSRDDVIGEVVCPLAGIDLQQIENQQVALSREIQPRSLKIRAQGRGELLISLCWQPAAARLTVVLLKARNLPRMDVTGLADPYVKIYLLYNGQRIAKKKTHVKKRTLSPVFNESFAFDIPSTEGTGATLEGVSLELMLLDWDRVTKNEVIGRLELGGPRSTGSALNHWKEVCNSPRRQIADWHKLRE
ncbi:hypothetical protein pipiens_003407 [Culex pipiens pipiens]|uniref:C2 domain-containing protein n=1 Tax=Culex pipiens pipiens TaxID=38569 RepID=A0ABD1CYW6_CULPP